MNTSSARAGRLLLAGSALAALALTAGCSNSSTSTATTPPATTGAAQGGSAPATESGPTGTAAATTAPASGSAATTTPATTAPAGGGAGSAAAGTTACSSRYLRADAGQPSGAAGSTYLEITFTNLNNAPCTLFGYPGVVLAKGTPVTPVGAPADRVGGGATTVTLAPHGVASALLRIVDALNFPASACTPVGTTWIQVIPPNQTAPLYVSYTSMGCTNTATHLLTIAVVKPGSGA